MTYESDAFNRRVLRKKNGTIQSRYIYDGDRIIAEMNSNGTLKKRFIYGTRANVPDYMIVSGVKYRIFSDHLGSVRLVVKTSDGTVQQKMEYNELGKVIVDTVPGFQPFGYAGGLYDVDTKLVRFGARDYDGEFGRWLSKDPKKFEGGDSNLYGYVEADPINFIDQDGQSRGTVTGIVVGGLVGGAIGAIRSGGNPVATAIGAIRGGLMVGTAAALLEIPRGHAEPRPPRTSENPPIPLIPDLKQPIQNSCR